VTHPVGKVLTADNFWPHIQEEAEDRIFFISAKEALQTRLQEAKGLPPNIGNVDSNWYGRLAT
jgi:hypothetical protein